MAVEVVTPEDYLGDVMGTNFAALIEHLEPRGNAQVIKARVPLAAISGYATDRVDAGPGDFHDAIRAI